MIKITKKQDIALQLKHGVGYIEYSQSKIINAEWAYYYAVDVNKGPWPRGEKVIASHPYWSYQYALGIIKNPWPLGEGAISSDPELAYCYARHIIRGSWSFGEATIFSDTKWKKQYQEFLKTLC